MFQTSRADYKFDSFEKSISVYCFFDENHVKKSAVQIL